jgi:RNA polymerase sigma-70 factor (ECF subfamily)
MADYLTKAFLRIRQKLKYLSVRYLTDANVAEDILQDSFVRLWQRRYSLCSEKEAEALLNKTVRNASLNEKRRKKTAPLVYDYPDDSINTVEREKAYFDLEQKIKSELTETQQYILKEKEYGGRTLEDIAKELKMAPAAVRMQLSRARKILRNALIDDR